eukprot:CAMPEP_0117055660 /NCGR_PEP_ID=MMETSP0472-20121206/38600_1 /TAXON_ID=693140 ORGANISM="Tiarina fusus, Strain LIS" /NCGR_SAMPLE_ID=MMETSP0472 /ASSEMBLY_ACC=CAM_ASM_000603 /LENGTH=141 /DNA_ID=CAMNT_0004771771 /DNA_START=131 /DNA_END=553 /DNA_ORIENTATION=-
MSSKVAAVVLTVTAIAVVAYIVSQPSASRTEEDDPNNNDDVLVQSSRSVSFKEETKNGKDSLKNADEIAKAQESTTATADKAAVASEKSNDQVDLSKSSDNFVKVETADVAKLPVIESAVDQAKTSIPEAAQEAATPMDQT